MNAAPLRPLSIGQLLDRAVTLSVKFFVPLALIYGAFEIPVNLISVYTSSQSWHDLAQLFDDIGRGANRGEIANTMAHMSQGPNPSVIVLYLLLLVAAPLSRAAVALAISSAYLDGRALGFVEAYRRSLRCWLPLFGLTLVWIATALMAYLAFVLMLVAAGMIVALLYALLPAIAITVGVLLGIALLVAVVCAVSVTLLAAAYSYFAVILEGMGFITAFASGISREFGRSIRRALWTGLAGFAAMSGFSLIEVVVGALVFFLLFSMVRSVRHDSLAAVLAGSAAAVPVAVIGAIAITAFFEVAYFDVRVRSEGFDLERAAAAEAPALPEPA